MEQSETKIGRDVCPVRARAAFWVALAGLVGMVCGLISIPRIWLVIFAWLCPAGYWYTDTNVVFAAFFLALFSCALGPLVPIYSGLWIAEKLYPERRLRRLMNRSTDPSVQSDSERAKQALREASDD